MCTPDRRDPVPQWQLRIRIGRHIGQCVVMHHKGINQRRKRHQQTTKLQLRSGPRHHGHPPLQQGNPQSQHQEKMTQLNNHHCPSRCSRCMVWLRSPGKSSDHRYS